MAKKSDEKKADEKVPEVEETKHERPPRVMSRQEKRRKEREQKKAQRGSPHADDCLCLECFKVKVANSFRATGAEFKKLANQGNETQLELNRINGELEATKENFNAQLLSTTEDNLKEVKLLKKANEISGKAMEKAHDKLRKDFDEAEVIAKRTSKALTDTDAWLKDFIDKHEKRLTNLEEIAADNTTAIEDAEKRLKEAFDEDFKKLRGRFEDINKDLNGKLRKTDGELKALTKYVGNIFKFLQSHYKAVLESDGRISKKGKF